MSAGVAPLSLRISITERCGLRCLYCRPMEHEPPRVREQLAIEEIVRFVRVAKTAVGVDKVRLTGGEPLLRGDVVELVAALAALGIADLALTTNGQRLAPMCAGLRRAGLQRLNVSLDTLAADTFTRLTRGGKLTDTLAGIDAALAAGLTPLRINTVVMRGKNDREAEALVARAIHHGYEQRFIELMPSGLAPEDYAAWFLSSAELRERLAASFSLAPLLHAPGSSSRRYRVRAPDGGQGVIGFISPNSHPFCSGCRRLRLTAGGDLLGCLGRADHLGLLSLLRDLAPTADERITLALRDALDNKRGPGTFVVARPMSRVGG